ncbi:2OG-Fe(II) oxygenase [Sphingomonas arantia]|uniref:2OG-Fe(II) oxygenase n=1 Tax=Sphingomonas arantia TaxID=1460676 RepID=A0ABW4U2L4_9SPHN
MDTSPLDRVDALLTSGQPDAAVDIVRQAAAAGDAAAHFRLATWHLIGDPLPRNLQAARRYLTSAVAIGHVDAALMEVALTANGGGAPADWPAALALLERAAAGDPLAADHLRLVQAMKLDPSGLPLASPSAEVLYEKPDVRRFPSFLSAAECRHIALAAQDLLAPALVADPRTGRTIPNPIRVADEAVIGPTREDLVIRAINRRIATASGTDVAQGEALTILRYGKGQQFKPHLDTLPAVLNQRGWTMLIYLNDQYHGGETLFPRLDLKVKGRPGDALLFRNLTDDGSPDPATIHAGLPIEAGVKWLCTRWIRQEPFDPWAGVPA